MQRFPSVLFSVIFHLSLVVLVVFWPAPEPAPIKPFTGAMVQGLVTIGKAGGPAKITSKNTPKKTTTVAKVAENEPAPEARSTAPPRVEPEVPVTPPKEVKPVEKPQEPSKSVEKTPPQKPVEKPEAVKIAEKREDKPAEKPKPEAKTEDKQKKKSVEKPVEKPKTPKKEKGSATSQALADLNKEKKKPSSQSGSASSGDSAAAALKAFESELGGGDGSGMGSGSGYGEAGYGDSLLIGSYTDSLVSRIKPNWSWTGLAERRALEARFLIKVAPDGTIESHQLIQSSGNSSFDASVTKAIVLTTQVEPPPPGIPNGEIMVVFRPDAMMQ